MAKKLPRKPAKRSVSVAELRIHAQQLEAQARIITELVGRIDSLKRSELEVRGPERFVRANAAMNDYLADLTGAVTRIELERSAGIPKKK